MSAKFISKNPDFIAAAHDRASYQLFMQQLGFSLAHLAEGEASGTMRILKEHRQHQGFLHGGISAVLCDIVAGFAAFTLVAPGESVVTSNLQISYFNPGAGDELLARGWVMKAGGRLIYCESEILVNNNGAATVDEWTTVVKSTATMCIIEDMPVRRQQ